MDVLSEVFEEAWVFIASEKRGFTEASAVFFVFCLLSTDLSENLTLTINLVVRVYLHYRVILEIPWYKVAH